MILMVMDCEKLNDSDVSSVELIAYGASPITEAASQKVFEKFPSAEFFQAFGQTELSQVATILDTSHHSQEALKSGKLRSCGRARRVCEIQIVDENDQDMKNGDIGHIIVSGPITMLGYRNKPDVTAETIKDGWVYTGDAGYMDEDGLIFLMDRLKDRIVSGGENIYSTEVENALARHPALATSAVLGIPHEKWGEAVHAIVILKPGNDVSEAALKENCPTLIAGYKCPQSIPFRTEPFLLSGANKVLKTALWEPFWKGCDRMIS
jgi:acyl-CoA synthetase (AMP-forming)/AMP-acid ligase II